MDDAIKDIWSDLMVSLTPISTDRCQDPPQSVSESMEKLLAEMLALAYDRDTTPVQVTRFVKAMNAAYQLGRGKERLATLLKRST